MTTFNKSTRSYLFRERIADLDRRICNSGKGPMVLTWRQARHLFKEATIVVRALREYHQIEERNGQ